MTYPATISGTAEDKVLGGSAPIVARRTGEQDDDGCEVYVVEIPYPGNRFASGQIALAFDLVPGRSSFRLQFESSTP